MKRKWMKMVIALALSACMAFSGQVPAMATEGNTTNSAAASDSGESAFAITRLAGDTRYATAIESANELKTILGVSKFSTVVLASGVNFPDALAGSSFAAQKDAPILLVGSNDSNQNQAAGTALTLSYVKENLTAGGTVYVLGGTSAVSEKTEATLIASGFQVVRLAGDDRYETNLAIINEMDIEEGGDIVVVRGYTSYKTDADKKKKTNPQGYADSLSVSGVAGANGMPIFLTDSKGLTTEQLDKISSINPTHIYVIGGTSAVSDAVYEQIDEETIGAMKRIYGENRYETSIAIAEEFGLEDSASAVIAYGQNYPDGLTGGVLAAKLGAPLLLTESGKTSYGNTFLKSSLIRELYVLGGTAVLPEKTISALISGIPADFTEKLDRDITIYSFDSDILSIPVNTTEIVTFTAEMNVNVVLDSDEIEVLSSEGEVIGYMNDDGTGGDTESGDCIYTLRTALSGSEEKYVDYYVDVDNLQSEAITIGYYAPLTDSEISAMEDVDTVTCELVTSEEFQNATIDQRVVLAETKLDQLSDQGLIMKDSIFYDDSSNSLEFDYSCGVSGGVMLEDISDDYNADGSGKDINSEVVTTVNEEQEQSASLTSVSDYNDLTDEIDSVLILHGFGNSPERIDFYNSLVSAWSSIGISTTLDTYVTVSDMKKLKGYDVIVFSMHGNHYTPKYDRKVQLPILSINESVTKANNATYSYELKTRGSIAKVMLTTGQSVYWVFPRLFQDNYSSTALNGELIFSESCCFFGCDCLSTTPDNSMANALTDSGAEVVVGYHNSVEMNYSRDIMKDVIEDSYNNGSTITNAVNTAKNAHGVNDANKTDGWEDVSDDKYKAYPCIVGNGDYILQANGALSGEVVNGSNNQAITNAIVHVYKDGRIVKTTRTSSSGSYRITGLDAGSYTLQIYAAKYESISVEATVFSGKETALENILLSSIYYDVANYWGKWKNITAQFFGSDKLAFSTDSTNMSVSNYGDTDLLAYGVKIGMTKEQIISALDNKCTYISYSETGYEPDCEGFDEMLTVYIKDDHLTNGYAVLEVDLLEEECVSWYINNYIISPTEAPYVDFVNSMPEDKHIHPTDWQSLYLQELISLCWTDLYRGYSILYKMYLSDLEQDGVPEMFVDICNAYSNFYTYDGTNLISDKLDGGYSAIKYESESGKLWIQSSGMELDEAISVYTYKNRAFTYSGGTAIWHDYRSEATGKSNYLHYYIYNPNETEVTKSQHDTYLKSLVPSNGKNLQCYSFENLVKALATY